MVQDTTIASSTLTAPSTYGSGVVGIVIPTNSTPMSTDGIPRGSSANRLRPTARVTLAACTSSGRAKSTAMSPFLIRSATSVRPKRLTEPSRPWLSQTYALIAPTSYPPTEPPDARTVAKRMPTLSSPNVALATSPPSAARR